MRKRRKVKFVITLLLILNVLLISSFPTKVRASESEVNAILNSAKSKLYSSAYDGLCQAFVKSCYEAAGIYASSNAGSATEARKRWMVSKDLSNIPIGASVYFTYNHVAIYLGNDVITHTASGYYGNSDISYVIQSSLSERINKGEIAGWGYQAGYNLYRTSNNNPIKTSFPLINNGIYKIRNVNSGKVLEVPGASTDGGVQLQQYDDNGGRHQLWKAIQCADGYSFVAVHSGKAMDLYGATGENGAKITHCGYHGGENQRFKLVDRGNGRYSIHPVTSDLSLDVYGYSTDNGALIYQYAYHGDPNQLFTFEAVDTTAPTISNVQVTNVTRDGYTVTCYVEDNAGGVGVERVSFPTWSDVNGQDDLSSDWYNVCAVYPSGTGNTYTFNVNVANHGYAEGGYTTHIYAYDKLGNCSSAGTTAYINRQIALQSFTLSASSINLNINQTQKLSVTSYTPSDTTVDKTATWQSSDSTVATVDSQGNVKALKAGTATITCTVAGKTKTCTVKVAKAVTESPAKITKQPTSQKVNEGKTATFTVKASGSGLTYQWQVSKNNGKKWSNTSLSGNKTSKLKVKATKGRNGYRFRCIVKDKKGNTITSKAVKLTVTSNVKITKQPSSQKVKEGKTVTFTVKASGTKLKYQWQVSKDNGKKWSNTSLSGSKTSKLKVKATEGRNGYKFRCIIKDKNGKKVTSKAVKLTVTTMAKTAKHASNLEVDNTAVITENIEIIEEIKENSVSSNDISVSSGDSLSEE